MRLYREDRGVPTPAEAGPGKRQTLPNNQSCVTTAHAFADALELVRDGPGRRQAVNLLCLFETIWRRKKMVRSYVLGAVALLATSIGPAYSQGAPLSTCPTQTEVNASIQKWYVNYHMGQFRIKSVNNFEFGAARFGTITKGQVEWGQSAQDSCPVRVSYSFVVTGADGQPATIKSDDTKTHYFYKNGFDEWIFKIGT
jgi:hypothetical protein